MPNVSARANIALIKYWGKRDSDLNLPAAGSLSLTLEALETQTSVELNEAEADLFFLHGEPADANATARVSRFLDLIRARGSRRERAIVKSSNSFPTAAGLASSASAFAALAKAACVAYEVEADDRELSILARQGSGSAARSVFGGFARMHAGHQPNGNDAFAEPFEGSKLTLGAVIAVARTGAKAVGSTEGMERTRETSPYHDAWIHQVDADLEECQLALREGDFDRLARVVEGSCLAMHANAMAARPGLIYLGAPTLWAIDRVRQLRAQGLPVCFTIDAGPHLVAFTPLASMGAVADGLKGHPDVAEIMTTGPGVGARIEANPPAGASQ